MIEEIQAIFPSDATLQDAIARLTQRGIDRADLSLPTAQPAAAENTPEAGAASPHTDTDSRQIRTMNTGMAAYSGAVVAGAAVTMATGGIAAPVAAAVAGAAAAAAASEGVAFKADAARHDDRQDAAARGDLVLAVHLRAPDQQPMIEQAMADAGASRIARVVRERPATDSSGWTG